MRKCYILYYKYRKSILLQTKNCLSRMNNVDLDLFLKGKSAWITKSFRLQSKALSLKDVTLKKW